jgi:hypothetical protein
MFGVSLAGLLFFANMLQAMGKQVGLAPQQQNLAMGLYAVAIVFGILVGQWFASLGNFIGSTWFSQRKDKLLVNCWDAMQKLLSECDENAGK